MKPHLSNYSEIIFYYSTRIHSKLKAFLTNVSVMFLTSAPLGDVTPVLCLHRIVESVSPPNLIHLGYIVSSKRNGIFYEFLFLKFYVVKKKE